MKNHSLSLMLVLSIALSGATPALNAMQTIKRGLARAMPAWTKGPGFTAAKKWWKAGRNVNALTPQEQAAFNTLKKRVAIGTIIAALTALLGAAAFGIKKQQQAEKQKQQAEQQKQEKEQKSLKWYQKEIEFSRQVEAKLKGLSVTRLGQLKVDITSILKGKKSLPTAENPLAPFDRGFTSTELITVRTLIETQIRILENKRAREREEHFIKKEQEFLKERERKMRKKQGFPSI